MTSRALLAAGGIAAALVFAFASAPAAAGGASGAGLDTRAQAPAATLVLHPCRLPGLTHDAQCGSLQRPLDPDQPQRTRIELQVAVLPAIARQKRADPVFFFAGGPGQSAIALAGTIDHLLGRIGERRDVVLIDQRGTGHSAPLHCDSPDADEALARALDRRKAASAMQACRVALQGLPWGDLRFYTTTLAMSDADAVRAALGADRIDLVGISYGTRAALEYLRLYPQHVRRVVLDGVAPPDMVLPESSDIDSRAALDAVLAACIREPACAHAHPQVEATWQGLLASMPRTVSVADPTDGRPLTLAFTREALVDLVRPALYRPDLGAMLPHAIEEAAAGRFGVLLTLATALGGGAPGDIAEGEHFSVVCSEDVPRLTARAVSASADDDVGALYRDVCAQWPRGAVDPAFYGMPRSAVPVLLLSGGADPITPPRHAARVAQALGPQARQVVVTHSGHGVLALPCMADGVYRFIDAERDDPALAHALDCASGVPRPLAFQPSQPQRAASAPNDPHGFGDGSPHAPSPPHPPPEPPPAPHPARSGETPR